MTPEDRRILDKLLTRNILVDPEDIQGTPEAIKFVKTWQRRRTTLKALGFPGLFIYELWLKHYRLSGLKLTDLEINKACNTDQANRLKRPSDLDKEWQSSLLEQTRAKTHENPFAHITKNDLMIGLRNDRNY